MIQEDRDLVTYHIHMWAITYNTWSWYRIPYEYAPLKEDEEKKFWLSLMVMLKPKKNPSDVKVRVQKTKVLIDVITTKLVIRVWCLLVSLVVTTLWSTIHVSLPSSMHRAESAPEMMNMWSQREGVRASEWVSHEVTTIFLYSNSSYACNDDKYHNQSCIYTPELGMYRFHKYNKVIEEMGG